MTTINETTTTTTNETGDQMNIFDSLNQTVPIATDEETVITISPKKETKKSLKYDCIMLTVEKDHLLEEIETMKHAYLTLTLEKEKLTTKYMEEKEADLIENKVLKATVDMRDDEIERLTQELEDAKKVKTTKTKRVKSDVVLTGEHILGGEYKYELTDELANHLTRGDMNDEDYVKECKKTIYDGEKSPTLKDVYTYIYEGYTGREDWTTDEPTITITPTTEKKEVKNPKTEDQLNAITDRCEGCLPRGGERCKNSSKGHKFGERLVCLTHKKACEKKKEDYGDDWLDVWGCKGGWYNSTEEEKKTMLTTHRKLKKTKK